VRDSWIVNAISYHNYVSSGGQGHLKVRVSLTEGWLGSISSMSDL